MKTTYKELNPKVFPRSCTTCAHYNGNLCTNDGKETDFYGVCPDHETVVDEDFDTLIAYQYSVNNRIINSAIDILSGKYDDCLITGIKLAREENETSIRCGVVKVLLEEAIKDDSYVDNYLDNIEQKYQEKQKKEIRRAA